MTPAMPHRTKAGTRILIISPRPHITSASAAPAAKAMAAKKRALGRMMKKKSMGDIERGRDLGPALEGQDLLRPATSGRQVALLDSLLRRWGRFWRGLEGGHDHGVVREPLE